MLWRQVLLALTVVELLAFLLVLVAAEQFGKTGQFRILAACTLRIVVEQVLRLLKLVEIVALSFAEEGLLGTSRLFAKIVIPPLNYLILRVVFDLLKS